MKNREQWHKTICDIQLSVFFLCHSSFDKQCFSVVSWLIVAVSQYFVALHAQHFPSRFAYAQLERNVGRLGQQHYCDQSYNDPRSCSVILPILIKNDNAKILIISISQQLFVTVGSLTAIPGPSFPLGLSGIYRLVTNNEFDFSHFHINYFYTILQQVILSFSSEVQHDP